MTNDRQLCEDHLGLLDPALRAAAVAAFRARCDLHVAQTKRLPRDVVLDLLLNTQLLAVPPVFIAVSRGDGVRVAPGAVDATPWTRARAVEQATKRREGPPTKDTATNDAYVDRARGRHAFSGMNVPTK